MSDKAWAELALAYIESLPAGWAGLAADIRKTWPGRQLDDYQAWRAVIRTAVSRGMLVQSALGQYRRT